jgi:hypothetical protein
MAGGALLPFAAPLLAQENASLTEPAESIVPALKQFTQGAAVTRGKVKLENPVFGGGTAIWCRFKFPSTVR